MIDLHIHSTASDGSLKPLEIIDLAKTRKLQAVSLTDHDTIDGAKYVPIYLVWAWAPDPGPRV